MLYENFVLVTGGAGFIGSAFLRILSAKHPDWFFINLDSLTYAGDLTNVESIANLPNYTFIHGNICDRIKVEKLFELYPINWIVNFAAESHVDNSINDSSEFIQTNVAGTHVLLDVAKKAWGLDGLVKPDDKYRFFQISTDEVYGSLGLDGKSWLENSPLLPNSPYAASKAAAELLCRSYFKTFQMPIVITRSSNNFGPFQNKEKFIPSIIHALINQKKIPIYGNGNNIRDWIYVEDNISYLEIVMISGRVGESYNIGGENELSNIKLALFVLERFGENKSELEMVDDRLGHDFRYSVDQTKLKSLQSIELTPFAVAIDKTINYYKQKIL
jgi:dTDP-glucose 4,6-dehydratase